MSRITSRFSRFHLKRPRAEREKLDPSLDHSLVGKHRTNESNRDDSGWGSCLRHRCPSSFRWGRGVFRGNDLTNIRKPSAASWCPCRDVWLEALERLTLSFRLSRARSSSYVKARSRAVSRQRSPQPSGIPVNFLRRFLPF